MRIGILARSLWCFYRIDFEVIKQAILDVWSNPGNRKLVASLRRLIWYYAEIVANRRAGDRQYKQRSFERNENDRPTIDVPLSGGEPVRPNDELKEFKETAIRIARAMGYPCEFTDLEWDARVVTFSSKIVVFDITCHACRFDEMLSVSRKEFEAIAKKVRQDFEDAMD